ncbi:MAG: ParA family protein [Verrucomicrobiota bacterium]
MQQETKSRVLLVDLDPQSNLSQLFLNAHKTESLLDQDRSVISLFEPGRTIGRQNSPREDWSKILEDPKAPYPSRDAIVYPLIDGATHPGRLDLICGQFDVAKYSLPAVTPEQKETVKRRFSDSLTRLRQEYDLVILDTNPTLSFLSLSAHDISNHILCPVGPNRFAIRGLRVLRALQEQASKSKPNQMIFVNRIPARDKTAEEFVKQFRNGDFDSQIANTKHGEEVSDPASAQVLQSMLPETKNLRPADPNPIPSQNMVVYRRGPGIKAVREKLTALARELIEEMEIRKWTPAP